jgi:rhamnulokinase
MSHYYVACNLGADGGRVMLGTLHKEELNISEVRRFENQPIHEKDSLQWNIPHLYEEILEGLRGIGTYDEPADSVSCSSWASDYLLFEKDGTLITPTYHHGDPRTGAGMKKILNTVSWETIYEETGIRKDSRNTLFQLAAESARRLKRAAHLMPVADGFNFLLTGVPRLELSLASATQLYNPIAQRWSDRLLQALPVSPSLLPPLVRAGTELGPLRPEIAKDTNLSEARVVSACSNELAALLVGLPTAPGESWAFLQPGPAALMGTQIAKPIINEVSRNLNYTNEMGYGGAISFYKHTVGLRILEECQRFWRQTNRDLDGDLLGHLAGSATPFESLINPTDPRFLEPGEMPLKIQAFCKETDQPVPRKPGPIYRCILESLALLYRKVLQETEYLTGTPVRRLFILGGPGNSLLHHFVANALGLPVTLAPADAAAIGSFVVQALALGHLGSLTEAKEIVRRSVKAETIFPHAQAWNAAFDRFSRLTPG